MMRGLRIWNGKNSVHCINCLKDDKYLISIKVMSNAIVGQLVIFYFGTLIKKIFILNKCNTFMIKICLALRNGTQTPYNHPYVSMSDNPMVLRCHFDIKI